MLALPEHPVFIDGRTDFYGEALVREFDTTTALKPGWEKPLDQYHVAWSLMPVDHRLNVALAAAGWERIYADPTSVIYRKRP